MSPSVSILCPTYARTALLVELIESFQRQQYDGDLELVVLNDCPLQALTCNVPGVRCINMPRFRLFGDKKNYGIRTLCRHDLLMVWDDDDIYLPSFVSTVVAKLRDGEHAARLRHLVQWNGPHAPSAVRSASGQHSCLFRRSAFDQSGGWRPLEAGQADTEFWFRVIPQWFRGRHHHEADGHLLTVYRADPAWRHMAPWFPDPLTQDRFHDLQDAHILNGEEPRGAVHLLPSWSRDWQAEVDAVQKVSRV